MIKRPPLAFFALLSVMLLTFKSYSQNLVMNPSFENVSGTCLLSGFTSLNNWYNPDPTNNCSTPDWFATCNLLGAPSNSLGNQAPRTGQAYAGFISYDATTANYREYVEGTLSSALAAGQTYCVTFYISLSDNSPIAVDHLGVYFSNTLLQYVNNCNNQLPLPVTPQLQYNTTITDKTNWVKVQWSYTATGGEQYFTIGNFFTDANCAATTLGLGFPVLSYYYIDDVSVVAGICSNIQAAASGTAPTCGQCNGTATATPSNGVTPYKYLWSNGNTTQSITGLCASTYAVTVTDSVGGSATASYTVAASTTVNASVSVVNASCGSNNGTATANATGTGPFSYLWNVNATTQTITGLGAGTYTVTVTGAGGCSATASTSITATNGLSLSATSTSPGCGATTGSATVSVTAGTGPYNYTWSNNETTQSVTNIVPGTYTVTVTGTGGCSATATTTVANGGSLNLSATATGTSCGNSNGSGNVSVTAGNGPYTYLWNNSSTTQGINNLPAGTYTVTVTGNGGCSATASATVNPSGSGNVNITSNRLTICSGDSAYICAPAGYNAYQWNTSQTTSCIYAKNPGNYYVTVTDNGSCTATSNHLGISVYPLPPTSISVRGDTLTAYNASSYQWFYNGVAIPGATSHIYIATQQGDYSVMVTDNNGCSALSNPTNIVLGINSMEISGQLKVYPNPLSSGAWQVELGAAWLGAWCEIFDASGRMVYRTELKEEKSAVKMDAAEGIYIMRVSTGQNSYTVKLVKL